MGMVLTTLHSMLQLRALEMWKWDLAFGALRCCLWAWQKHTWAVVGWVVVALLAWRCPLGQKLLCLGEQLHFHSSCSLLPQRGEI